VVIYKFRNLNTSQATPIPPGAYTVGRDDDSDVQVLDSSVSRHHAKIYNEGDGLYLEDAGSANGTSAHGTRITSRVKLNFGDMVNIGSVPFRIDPEVTAEGSSGPLPGMRSTGHTSITRPTERLPSPPVPGQAGTPVSLGNLPAREGNQVTDKATKTPGITTAVAPMAPPVRLPTAWPGTSGPPPENGPRPVSVPSTLTGTPGITAVPRIKKEPSPPAPGR